MNNVVDNFDAVKQHLKFQSPFDRYVVHILKRAKDDVGTRKYRASDKNRLLKTFYVSSVEYLENKIPVLKDLCDSNNARAYILPQVRDNSQCLRQLLKEVVDNLDNPTIKPEHLIRSAYCGNHFSKDKKWIFDLDSDNMVQYDLVKLNEVKKRIWTPEEVLNLVKSCLSEIGKNPEDAYLLPTRNGHCVVSPTFNLQKAHEKCLMFFEGIQTIPVDVKWTGPGEFELKRSKIDGWLKKDGMALLYCNL